MLHELPPDHPDRNRPLAGCFYRWKNAKVWREIFPTYGIAKRTYNELGEAWADNDVFSWTKGD